MKRARILLGDDHGILAEGLRHLLEPDFEVVGVVADGRALERSARELDPDVIVSDISMPLLNGLEAARHILKANPRVRIVFLTMHADPAYATEALEAGAAGYVVKSSASGELVTAIRETLKGGTYVSPSISDRVFEALLGRATTSMPKVKLTARQREVLQLIAEGHPMKEIADILCVSPRTVEFHKYRIMETLGVRSNAELTQFAIRHGMVAP